MEFLGNLGIDIKLLIAQIVNFGLLLWLLTRFLYKPIINRIEKDENVLKQAKIQVEKFEREKKVFLEQQKKDLANSKNRAGEIIKEAEIIATEIKGRAADEAGKEKKAVIKQIKSRLSEIEDDENSK